ncbi:hypothetical protein RUM44_002566 [Polyplax serrata]|uniref:Uncharacterized protein n=1 Tax=Polyplax serrata TaxID=468196 RepID=A0ABR1AF55_POLSC
MRMDTTGMLKSLFMSGQSPASGGNATVFEISPRLSLLDSCHKKIRLIGGAPVAFLGGLVANRDQLTVACKEAKVGYSGVIWIQASVRVDTQAPVSERDNSR